MSVRQTKAAVLVAAASLLTAAVSTTAVAATSTATASRHVLLLSVDGLHQSDLAWYVHQHPTSALAKLVSRGRQFSNASTPFPSDSFPGMVAQVTGGDPRTTGVYYDVSYNHALDARHPGLLDRDARHGRVVRREPRPRPHRTGRGSGAHRPPGKHPVDDRHAADADQPRPAAGGPDHLPARLPALLPARSTRSSRSPGLTACVRPGRTSTPPTTS